LGKKHILPNILFCVPQQIQNENHSGLEQQMGEEMMTEFSFLDELSLKRTETSNNKLQESTNLPL